MTEFDHDWALTHLGGDAQLLTELAALFLQESATLLPALKTAVAQQDARAIERHAHNLKGAVANFGAKQLYSDARNLEQAARRNDLASTSALFTALEESVARFTLELQTLSKAPGG